MINKSIILTGVGIGVATVIVIASIIIGEVLPGVAKDAIEDALVVDKAEPNDESFQHWVSDNYSDAAPYYKVFSFLNLTNYYDVQATGAKPIYQEVGPYYYRRYQTKLNYTFFEDGDKVSYSVYQPLYYEPDLGNSSLNPYTDVIYNINPTYVGIIYAAGGEENLIQGLVAPTWAEIMNNINSEAGYVGLVIDQYFVHYLILNQQSLVYELGGDVDQFLTIWANATEDPTSPEGFNSTMRLSVNGYSSNISMESASLLFTMAEPLSLVSTNPAGFQTWFAAEQGDPTSIGYIQATFGINSQQMSMILSWRSRFKPTYYDSLSAYYGIADVSDLGYYQWGMANVTAVNISTYMQAFVTLPLSPEFALSSPLVFSVDQSKAILTGQRSMLNITNYITFITLLSQGNYGVIQAFWGLSAPQANALYMYINTVIINVYVVDSTLEPAFAAGGGMITWHTVDEWLWTCMDPLLMVLSPSNAACNLFHNDTSEAEATAENLASTYWTGKSDIDKIVEFIDYEGDTTIDIWETPQPVGGTDASQFAPDVKKSDVLEAFVSDLARTVDLTYQKKVSLKGIDLYRYILAPYMMEVDPTFYQSIAGFANMSSDNSGVPIFLSKPHFLDCDSYWVNQVEGLEPASKYDTTIDVEPLTGYTMQAHKRLQLNVYYTNTTQWTSLFAEFNSEMPNGLFYPVVWVDETSTLTDKQADDFKSSVLEPLRAFRITFIVGTVVGVLMVVGFIAATVYLVKRHKEQGVDVIDLATPM